MPSPATKISLFLLSKNAYMLLFPLKQEVGNWVCLIYKQKLYGLQDFANVHCAITFLAQMQRNLRNQKSKSKQSGLKTRFPDLNCIKCLTRLT